MLIFSYLLLNSIYDHQSGDLPPAELQSIYLQGSLPHESQILVADAQTKSESVPTSNDDDYEGTEDEPAVHTDLIN